MRIKVNIEANGKDGNGLNSKGGNHVAAVPVPVAGMPVSALPSLPLTSAVNPANQSLVKYRHVGKTGLKIPNVALGSMKLFSSDNPDVSEAIVTAAFEAGINFFDISDPFNQDRAEKEFGRIFKKNDWRHRDFMVCTKVFWSNSRGESLSRKEIIESVNRSLENLQLDYIDLLVISKNDINCPAEEIVRTVTQLINAGKLMYWGTSRWTPVEIYEAFSVSKAFNCIGPACEMAEYHWFHREKVELYMAELYNKIGLGLLTWSPVSFGLCLGGPTEDSVQLLTKLYAKSVKNGSSGGALPLGLSRGSDSHGHISDNTSTATGGGGAANTQTQPQSPEPQSKIKQLQAVAEKLNCTINQLLVAWCVRNQTSQAVILSAATVEQFHEILGSLPVVKNITMSVYEDIDRILANKPARPRMISTLQQRWATTGGIPPC